MTRFPFAYRPDEFSLKLPEGDLGLVVSNFDTEWGTTDELLCFADGVLVGDVQRRVGLGTPQVIRLTPQLDRRRDYPWPVPTAFRDAVERLLEARRPWVLTCYRDTDQYPIEKIRGVGAAIEALRIALAYCAGGSSTVQCPTFEAFS